MQLEELKKGTFVVGMKQVLRAVEQGKVECVYVANDAEERVTHPIVTACEVADVRMDETYTRTELGRACKLQVGAAAVAVLTSHR